MPLYDYRCTECDREVEVVHGIHDSGPETCEVCGGAMRKALSSPAIHFRGSGWAKKDAAAASAKAKPKASSSSDKKTPASDKAGGDADSATTASDSKGTDAATSSGKASSPTSGTAD